MIIFRTKFSLKKTKIQKNIYVLDKFFKDISPRKNCASSNGGLFFFFTFKKKKYVLYSIGFFNVY